jgi:phosphohistidine phosphatase
MPRELLILRNAVSDWESNALTDFDRPLAKRGKRDAPKIGAWLYREGLIPRYVVSSPARRARQTATRACKSLEIRKRAIVWDPKIYEANLADLLGVLGRCPVESATVLLVGHNPGLEYLVRHLCGNDLTPPPDGNLLPEGALARLEMPEHWDQLAQGCAQLVSITRPRPR